ncbi:amidohydrolase family protein [Saccharothrix australiensis]|uniref:5-methylthioadenosine/S-adenosylhomocysteine deaminase n=1 Tax=Saccharothrix australiensis TaxID=2072 RepID=A0A495W5P6_9PSEU|nr:amidohydrolase family protein [Saccharothrix australiensis]RKT55138.1 5-methylthioadenosine/S-adenosylhomocysteine deaminase [Saccharothrix australiensis]
MSNPDGVNSGPDGHATLIRGGVVHTADDGERVYPVGSVLVVGDRVAAVGDVARVDAAAAELSVDVRTVDADGMMVLPGFVNGHWHDMFAGRVVLRAASRPPSDRDDQPGFFSHGGDLPQVTAAFDAFHDLIAGLAADEASAIARYSLWTQLRSGTTTVGDTGSLNRPDALVDAARSLGIRLSVSTWASDAVCLPGEHRHRRTRDTDRLLAELADLLRTAPGGTVRVRPSALYVPAMSDELGRGLADLVSRHDTRFATHVAALRNESEAVRACYGTTPVRRLADLGLLTDRLTAVHCAFVDDEERELLVASGAHISHSPAKYGPSGESTLSETAVLTDLVARGVGVSLSTDGGVFPLGSMAEAMRAAWQAHNEIAADNTRVLPSTALAMATRTAARGLGWDDEVGSLEVGKQADLVLVRTTDWRYLLNPRPLEAFLTLGGSLDVDTVMVAGRVLVRAGHATEVDEDELEREYLRALRSYSARHPHVSDEVLSRVFRTP